jgi:hypothetical protein
MKIFVENIHSIVMQNLIHYVHINGVQHYIEDGKYFLRLS